MICTLAVEPSSLGTLSSFDKIAGTGDGLFAVSLTSRSRIGAYNNS